MTPLSHTHPVFLSLTAHLLSPSPGGHPPGPLPLPGQRTVWIAGNNPGDPIPGEEAMLSLREAFLATLDLTLDQLKPGLPGGAARFDNAHLLFKTEWVGQLPVQLFCIDIRGISGNFLAWEEFGGFVSHLLLPMAQALHRPHVLLEPAFHRNAQEGLTRWVDRPVDPDTLQGLIEDQRPLEEVMFQEHLERTLPVHAHPIPWRRL